MEKRRPRRIARLLEREISTLLMALPDLPARDLVTVTDVEVSPDLRHAKVFYSVLTEQEEDWQMVGKVLIRHAKEMRHKLAHRVVMKYLPEISFIPDLSIGNASHIETLLKQIHEADNGGSPDDAIPRAARVSE